MNIFQLTPSPDLFYSYLLTFFKFIYFIFYLRWFVLEFPSGSPSCFCISPRTRNLRAVVSKKACGRGYFCARLLLLCSGGGGDEVVNTCCSYMNLVADELKNYDVKSNNFPWGFHPGKVVLMLIREKFRIKIMQKLREYRSNNASPLFSRPAFLKLD